jgi:uncharacterized UPF0160 family protein
MHKIKVAVTHDGVFHADDVFASIVLHMLGYRIVRTRDPKTIEGADVVFDVGGKFDPEAGRFDHHQYGFEETRPGDFIRYSSFGLIWKHFGRELCSCNEVWEIVDRDLARGIDAIDNGHDDLSFVLSISQAISAFNAPWTDEAATHHGSIYFAHVMNWAHLLFENLLQQAENRVKAIQVVVDTVHRQQSPVLVLDRSLPWKHALASMGDDSKHVAFVVYQDKASGTWRAQTVDAPKEELQANDGAGGARQGPKAHRCSFPPSWAGLGTEELRQKSGVRTALFCARGRWIAGAETLTDACTLALGALARQESIVRIGERSAREFISSGMELTGLALDWDFPHHIKDPLIPLSPMKDSGDWDHHTSSRTRLQGFPIIASWSEEDQLRLGFPSSWVRYHKGAVLKHEPTGFTWVDAEAEAHLLIDFPIRGTFAVMVKDMKIGFRRPDLGQYPGHVLRK